jgi:5'-deoxynucleotidase YfbR-like HD superfamily hydrolase
MDLFAALTGPVSRMSYVNRYSSFPTIRRENVAEHSWWVCFIAYLIGGDLYKEHGEHINFEMLLEKALIHDVSECLSGDIIRSYKHSTPMIAGVLHDADELNVLELFKGEEFDPIGVKLTRDWQYAKNETTEGQIVRFADMVAVVLYCREEDRCGNRAIRVVVAEMYQKWFHAYHDTHLFGRYMEQLFPNRNWGDAFRETAFPRFTAEGRREGPVAEYTHIEGEGTP